MLKLAFNNNITEFVKNHVIFAVSMLHAKKVRLPKSLEKFAWFCLSVCLEKYLYSQPRPQGLLLVQNGESEMAPKMR